MAQRKTKVRGKTARYTNRNLPATLLRELKLAAIDRHQTMEEVCNEALRLGLKALRAPAPKPAPTTDAQATA